MIKVLKYSLFPFSILYWIITYTRNLLFDIAFLKSTKCDIPIISVGNITVGGTGKTPHVQYIINLLQNYVALASLSRGYKRSTKGFVLATSSTTVNEIGDEPYLLHKRFPEISVAVCEDRVGGVQKIMCNTPSKLVVLDDAFQHRKIACNLQIVLVDYNRPLWKDYVFPVGFLREGAYAIKRAQVVIVTKCPALTIAEQNYWRKNLCITKQILFFTKIAYGSLYDSKTKVAYNNTEILQNASILLVSGIAQSEPLLSYISSFNTSVQHCNFSDHHAYTSQDITEIYHTYLQLHTNSKTIIVTTEKDIYKLSQLQDYKIPIFVLPIVPEFIDNTQATFNELLLDVISKKSV